MCRCNGSFVIDYEVTVGQLLCFSGVSTEIAAGGVGPPSGAISEYPATFERHNSNAPVVPQSLSKTAILCYARSPEVP